MTGYVGINNKAQKIKNVYFGLNNVARKVKKGYIGVNGVAQLWYNSQREWVWDVYQYGYNSVEGTSSSGSTSSVFYVGTSYILNQNTGQFSVDQTTKIAKSSSGASNAVGKYLINFASSSGTQTGDKVYLITAASYSWLNGMSLTVTPYTSQIYKGTLVNSVIDLDITTYPMNGVQGNYWYVLRDIGTVSYSGNYTEQCVYMTNKAYRLLTITGSGTLALGASSKADIWLCGGGASGDKGSESSGTGSGGAGAYAQSAANVTIQNLTIQIGSGGVGYVDAGSPRLSSWTPSAGGNSSISGDISLSATGAGTVNIKSGGTGGGGGMRRVAGGTGDGLSKLPFSDSYYSYSFCDGGGGGAYRNSSTVAWGGDGGTNGGDGAASIDNPTQNLGEHVGQGGGQYGGRGGGFGWSGYSSANGVNATGYGSGGGGGGCAKNSDNEASGGGGSGYQGVCFIRIPLE